MDYLPVLFSTTNKLTSHIIRVFDRQGGQMCPFSHVGIISECGAYVYEATYSAGVTRTPILEFEAKASDSERGQFPCLDKKAAYEKIRGELGKKYDLFGVLSLGIPFVGRDWEAPDKWWCSELLAHASGVFERENVRTIGVSFCHALTKYEE